MARDLKYQLCRNKHGYNILRVQAQSVLKHEEQWDKRGLVSVSGAARVDC